jgi:hypothetical protein
MKPRTRTWAVVQDLRPFGYRIESKHWSRSRAERRARFNRFLEVKPVADVLAYNARVEDIDEFDKELKLFNDQNRYRDI